MLYLIDVCGLVVLVISVLAAMACLVGYVAIRGARFLVRLRHATETRIKTLAAHG